MVKALIIIDSDEESRLNVMGSVTLDPVVQQQDLFIKGRCVRAGVEWLELT